MHGERAGGEDRATRVGEMGKHGVIVNVGTVFHTILSSRHSDPPSEYYPLFKTGLRFSQSHCLNQQMACKAGHSGWLGIR